MKNEGTEKTKIVCGSNIWIRRLVTDKKKDKRPIKYRLRGDC